MKHVQLYSAGLDSFIGYHYLKYEKGVNVLPIYFNLKTQYSYHEIITIRKSLPETSIEDLFTFTTIENTDAHVPYRNLFLVLGVASKYTYIDDEINIYINSMADDNVSDQGPKFLEQMNDIVNFHSCKAKFKVTSSMPLEWTKFDAVEWYIKNGFNPEHLVSSTFSCYNPVDGKECLSCKACFRKNTVLAYVGIFRPFRNQEIIDNYKKNLNKYHHKRRKAMEMYLDWLEERNQ